MADIPGTHKKPSQDELLKRLQGLTDEATELEKEYFEMGIPLMGIEWPDMTQFNLRTKVQLIFELLREVSGKSDIEMDIRLREIQIQMLKEMKPHADQARSDALASEILRGVHGQSIDNGGLTN